jgi:hypothetical protein
MEVTLIFLAWLPAGSSTQSNSTFTFYILDFRFCG